VGTDVWGLSAAQLEKGLVDVAGTSFLSSRPTLDTSSTWNDDNDDVADTPRPPAPAPGTLTGTAADDILDGTASGDTIAGLAGDDMIDGGAGADKLVGGTGDDRFVVDDGGDVIAELLGEGFDTVESSIDHTLGANVERLTLVGSAALDGTGNALDNAIYGNEAANLLRGLDGNDNLFGRPGDDRLEGGAGNDLLRGGSGRDVLVGGAGSDRFDWDSSTEAGIGTWRDVVLDFTRGSDVIDLAGIDAKSGTDADDAFRFIGGDSFNGIAGELRYRPYGTSDGVLVQGDIDGDRIGDFSIRIDGVEVLQQGDFVL
jgi:Ca2+-binding RTX toxin-like protein